MRRRNSELNSAGIVVAGLLLNGDNRLRLRERSLVDKAAFLSPDVAEDAIVLELIEGVGPVPLPLGVRRRTALDLAPGHRLLCEEPLLTLLAEGVAGNLVGELHLVLQGLDNLLLATVLVALELHCKVGATQAVLGRIPERSEGLADGGMEVLPRAVTQVSGLDHLRIVVWDLVGLQFVEDMLDRLQPLPNVDQRVVGVFRTG